MDWNLIKDITTIVAPILSIWAMLGKHAKEARDLNTQVQVRLALIEQKIGIRDTYL